MKSGIISLIVAFSKARFRPPPPLLSLNFIPDLTFNYTQDLVERSQAIFRTTASATDAQSDRSGKAKHGFRFPGKRLLTLLVEIQLRGKFSLPYERLSNFVQQMLSLFEKLFILFTEFCHVPQMFLESHSIKIRTFRIFINLLFVSINFTPGLTQLLAKFQPVCVKALKFIFQQVHLALNRLDRRKFNVQNASNGPERALLRRVLRYFRLLLL